MLTADHDGGGTRPENNYLVEEQGQPGQMNLSRELVELADEGARFKFGPAARQDN